MVTNDETTVKVSKWLIDEVDNYLRKNKRNMTEFPSKRTFVDVAVMSFLEKRGVKLNY
jgi:hypothetical protein